MIPAEIQRQFTREIPWKEVDCGDDGAPAAADPAIYKAWELGALTALELPDLFGEDLVNYIQFKLDTVLPGTQIEKFNPHWKLVYEKYGFLHLRTRVGICGAVYHVEIFSYDPHGTKRLDDAVFSNTEYPLGGKHFYM